MVWKLPTMPKINLTDQINKMEAPTEAQLNFNEIERILNSCNNILTIRIAFIQVLDNFIKNPNDYEYIKDEIMSLINTLGN
jgi:hypothetical protein